MGGFQVAVASVTGGSGATTVATALALAVARRFSETQFLDCDVEVPDAGLFLKPAIEKSTPITAEIPEVATDLCTGCGECRAACQYNAIRVVAGKAELDAESCKICGCCRLVCPVGAVVERTGRIGVVESGRRENIVFHRGSLDMGRPVGPQLIRGLKAIARADIPTVVDCGAGATSQVIRNIRGSDYCIVVTEPTPFGLHDLRLMLGVIGEIGVPAGIVINKGDVSSPETETLAVEVSLPVLMRIPFSTEIAALGSKGVALAETAGSWDQAFWDLYEQIARAR